MFTLSTFPALALLALSALLPKHWKWAAFGALLTLQDAALVVRPAPLGVAWAAFFGLLLTAFWVPPGRILREAASAAAALLFVLLLADFIGIMSVLTIFSKQFVVMPNFALFHPSLAVQSDFYKSHINQLLYLLLGIASTLWILAFNRQNGWPATFARIEHTLFGFVGCAVFLTLWEWFSSNYGLWYPSQLLHSDLASGAWNQGVAGVRRVSGGFSEPSELAGQLGIAATLLAARGPERQNATLRGVLVAFACATMLISTSTTGYAMLAAIATVYLGSALVLPPLQVRHGIQPGRYFSGSIRVFMLSAVGIVAGVALLDYLIREYNFWEVLQETLFYKKRSVSYAEREYSNWLAWKIFIDSRMIGIGLGGHVASAGWPGILSALGLLGGGLVFGTFLGGVLSPLLGPQIAASEQTRNAMLSGSLAVAAACATLMAGMLMALSNINYQLFWIVFAGALASAGFSRPRSGRPLTLSAQPPQANELLGKS